MLQGPVPEADGPGWQNGVGLSPSLPRPVGEREGAAVVPRSGPHIFLVGHICCAPTAGRNQFDLLSVASSIPPPHHP